MKFLVIVGLVLGAAAGCDASSDNPGFGSGTGGEPVNQRGDVDAGGAGGGAAGASGGGGAPVPGTGGANAAAGRSGAGGATAAGGESGSAGGSGGASASYLACSIYGWQPTSGTSCTKQVSAGVYQNGTKDGHPCAICTAPARAPGSTMDCTFEATTGLCVLSCSECTFQ